MYHQDSDDAPTEVEKESPVVAEELVGQSKAKQVEQQADNITEVFKERLT